MAKIKIIDVAQHAGVSKSTVSQFLNNRFDYMSKATKARVEASIKELNYIPNPIARSLKSGKNKTIGVIVRDITGFDTSRALRGIDDFCKANEYNAIIYNTDFDPDIEARSLLALKNLRVDGIIIASSGMNSALINEFNESDTPIVQFQLEYAQSCTDIVISDYKKAAFEATEYLIQLGHRKICFMTQDFTQVKSRNDRYQGYIEAHKKYDIPVDEQLIQYWDRHSSFENSIQSILNLPSPPSVFFTQHLAITTDLLRALEPLPIEIPQDISVIGFDEIPMAEFFKVPVTVVKQNTYKVGELSAKILLESISKPSEHKEIKRVSVACAIEKRHSCRDIRN